MEVFKYKYDDLFNPLLQALHLLGGSGSNYEIEEKVIEILKLSNEEIEDIQEGSRTKLSYRCSWARNYLKRYGLIESTEKAIWTLTTEGLKTKTVDVDNVKKALRRKSKTKERNYDEEIEITWEDELIQTLKSMDPAAFERLSQRLLRELGFTNVEVTGKSNDGGIDGVGVLKIGGVLSFHVVFQCKRYKDAVSSSAIRDFRGAMIGRADKGLFITTSSFTRSAKLEAQRDGAPPLDLIDGPTLAKQLKELRLGVQVKQVEEVSINQDWYNKI